MHIDIVPNRNSSPTILLRESYREGRKVKKRTLANLSSLATDQIEAIRSVLAGEKLVPVNKLFQTVASPHHGHVQAVLLAMKQLGFDKLIGSRPSRERDLVMAMVAARILEPDSKLATIRWWHVTTLPETLGVADADQDDLYGAMDWLLDRQERIEKKLAKRHLEDGGLVLYDLTSSYFEGETCPLAALGHNRDDKKGKLQVTYGLLTDKRGCPVAVSVFDGNTGDPKTLLPQVDKIRNTFGINEMVLIGDRGMISQKQINELKEMDGIDWITALRTGAIRKILNGDQMQLGLFDQRDLFELSHPDFPGERLIACRNPELAKLRAHKRQSLLNATVKELDKVRQMVSSGKLKGTDKIGIRVGKIINKYKVAKHFETNISDAEFEYRILEENVAAEAALDGVYVVRTSLPRERMDADTTVRNYKSLSRVEQAFRSLKTIDLKVRPIYHHLANRVRAHIFLCTLAYYVEWHMIEAWRQLLFADPDQESKETRDPVKPAQRSKEALRKVHTKVTDDGSEVHSFKTLLKNLSGIVRNVCRWLGSGNTDSTFQTETIPTPYQQRAFDLLKEIKA